MTPLGASADEKPIGRRSSLSIRGSRLRNLNAELAPDLSPLLLFLTHERLFCTLIPKDFCVLIYRPCFVPPTRAPGFYYLVLRPLLSPPPQPPPARPRPTHTHTHPTPLQGRGARPGARGPARRPGPPAHLAPVPVPGARGGHTGMHPNPF